jgi:hypothetical protein
VNQIPGTVGCLFCFWLVEDLAELVDRPTGGGAMARGGCLFAWNFSVTSSTVLMEAERRQ